jgi:pre-rRNA-processing protein TSR4
LTIRYELGGVPLPYAATSPLFRQLFPKAPNMAPKAQGDEEDIDVSPFFDPSSIPRCSKCSSPRVFEMQLVPSLISTLRPDMITTTGEEAAKKAKKQQTEEERKAELQKLARGELDGEDSEMEWGTVMVFGCERDCVGMSEEWVGVEWENSAV